MFENIMFTDISFLHILGVEPIIFWKGRETNGWLCRPCA